MKVIIIGDSCLDVFVTGSVSRLCPEAPVPVINPKKRSIKSGMAGNVFDNVRSLSTNLDVKFYTNETETSKTRFVDETSGYLLLRVDENDRSDQQFLESSLFEELNGEKVSSVGCVLISDYDKGFISEESIEALTKFFTQRGIPVMMDTKKILGDWSREVSFVKINEKEYQEQVKHIGDPTRFCRNLIVTLGKDGSKWTNTGTIVKGEEIEVRDVSGAGDTYFAAFAIKYLETKSVVESMKYANKAAAVAVSKHGVVAVNRNEIE